MIRDLVFLLSESIKNGGITHAISKYLIPGVTPAVATVGVALLSKIFKR